MITEYDGSEFRGWQIQPQLRTIQGVISECLSTILREEITLVGAGRTDAGVHACAQVANFHSYTRMGAETIRKRLNSILPHDIYVHKVSDAPDGFNSRYDATSKVYVYRVLQGRSPLKRYHAWEVKYRLNKDRMNQAAQHLIGEHDLSSFTVEARENSVIQISEAEWSERGDELIFKVEADRFLNKMVRMMVGRMVEIGRGRFLPEVMVELLEKRRKGTATPTAPAHGLYLREVKY